jgi:Flp pilus assembly protein TadD
VEAYTRLARLKAQLGDVEGARKDRVQALELAHDYKPALELKF